MQQLDDFMPVNEHYAALVAGLDKEDLTTYLRMRHVRAEVAYRNRTFVVYDIQNREPRVLDNLTVLDFNCDDARGASTEIRSGKSGETIVVGYSPAQLFDFPVFVHLSLHSKIRWSAYASDPLTGSLAFDLVMHTLSRLHLRERGVIYAETGVNFAKEFEATTA